MIEGSCLCGAIGYQHPGPATQAGNCHCSMCRKWSGSAFVSYLGVSIDRFAWLRRAGHIARYRSSAAFERLFCDVCGSSLAAWPTDPTAELTWLMMGALEGRPGAEPEKHIFVGSKADWFEITDALPRHDGFPSPSA